MRGQDTPARRAVHEPKVVVAVSREEQRDLGRHLAATDEGDGAIGAVLGGVLSALVGGLGITVGLGFYLPFNIVLPYSLGTALRIVSDYKLGHSYAENTGIPVAAGLIVGEALVGVGFAVSMIQKAI